jgi:hypothetical protein
MRDGVARVKSLKWVCIGHVLLFLGFLHRADSGLEAEFSLCFGGTNEGFEDLRVGLVEGDVTPS